MKILITGATGFIGQHLLHYLSDEGKHELSVLTRSKVKAKKNIPLSVVVYEWDPEEHYIEGGALEHKDIIIHLAGENIADGRWTEQKKKAILNSRSFGTQLIIDGIKNLKSKPQKMICASAIGVYGSCGDEELNCNSPLGTDFLAEVCKKWEHIALSHGIENLKTHILRFGMVLSRDGGALNKMLPIFKAGLGGRLGNGEQYVSWIHIHDLVSQIVYLIENQTSFDIYNAVSPSPIRSKVFTKTLADLLSRPHLLPVPEKALNLLVGELSNVLTSSQRVHPKHFSDLGFEFQFKNIEQALENILKSETNHYEQTQQKI